MNKPIYQRTVKESFFKHLVNTLISKELKKRAAAHNLKRGMPIAVFGNDWIGININIHGLFEKEYIVDLNQLLITIGADLSGSTAIDIGANIGNHSIEFSKVFNKVLCFEPNPRTFDILQANTKNINNIDTFNWGCGLNAGLLKLNEDFNNIGGSSAKISIEGNNCIDISIKPLDRIFDTLSKVGLIKIDVEGMEIEALKGAEKVILEFKPLICFEQHEQEFKEQFYETEVVDWLRSRGYRIYAHSNQKRKNIFFRRLNNIRQLVFGVVQNRKIVQFEKLPKGTYPMIYAIHSSVKI